MNLESNVENTNSASAVIPSRRRCSFCKNEGHNISTCNDSRLLDFQNLCINVERNLLPTLFIDWLQNYSRQYPNIVKSYAARYCGCSINYRMFTCLESIVVRIRLLNSTTEIVETETIQESRIEEIVETFQEPYNIEDEYRAAAVRFLERDENNNRMLSSLIRSLGDNGYYDLMNYVTLFEYIERINMHNLSIRNLNRKFNIKTNIVECNQNNECECNICYDNKEKKNFVKLNCGHEFCKDCIKQSFKNTSTKYPNCAFCRGEIKNIELSSKEILNEFEDLLKN